MYIWCVSIIMYICWKMHCGRFYYVYVLKIASWEIFFMVAFSHTSYRNGSFLRTQECLNVSTMFFICVFLPILVHVGPLIRILIETTVSIINEPLIFVDIWGTMRWNYHTYSKKQISSFRLRDNSVPLHECPPFWVSIFIII